MGSNFLITFKSDFDKGIQPFLWRIFLPDFLEPKWSWPVGLLKTFPVLVILKRFKNDFLVFIWFIKNLDYYTLEIIIINLPNSFFKSLSVFIGIKPFKISKN